MKKYICAALALLLVATMAVGCGRRNVSDHPNGRITDPTSEAPTIIPEPTMTIPTPTEDPSLATTRPDFDSTEDTGMTGSTGSTNGNPGGSTGGGSNGNNGNGSAGGNTTTPTDSSRSRSGGNRFNGRS